MIKTWFARKFRMAVIVIVVVLWGGSLAQSCTAALEPNQTPNEATPFSGNGCLTGTISVDNQDLFVWTLGEQDLADKAIAFDFESVDGALSTMFLMRLDLNDAGEYTQRNDLFTLSTNDGAKVSREYGKLEPGTYYL